MPSCGSIRPAIERSKVVLPQPDSPTIASVSPAASVSDTPPSASIPAPRRAARGVPDAEVVHLQKRCPTRARGAPLGGRPQCLQQAARISVLRPLEDLGGRPLLDDPPALHHGDTIGDVCDHAEVVRDQDDAEILLLAQVLQLGEDLRLHGHVERGRGLIGEQDLGAEREPHRDHHALAHSARELVRICAYPLARPRNAGALHQLAGSLERPRLGDERFMRL